MRRCNLDLRQYLEFEAKALPSHGTYTTRLHLSTINLLTVRALQVTVLAFTALHPVALIASTIWVWLRGRRGTGPIALPPGEEGQLDGVPPGERPAREVDVEAIWG